MKTVFNKQTALVKLTCLLSEDQLKLFLNIEPIFAAEVTQSENFAENLEQEVCTALEEVLPADHVDIDVLKDALKTVQLGNPVLERRIAKGIPPEESRSGKVVLLVKKLNRTPEVQLDEKGKANFKELHFFDNIEKDQIVARVYPPVVGKNGVSALGQAIPAQPAKEAIFQLSETLRLVAPTEEQSYSTIVANQAGYLLQDGDKLSISNELRINSDIDYRTGNINFIGKVFISGNVKPGFAIKAQLGIELNGALEAGRLDVTAGSISISGLAYGGEKSHIKASEDVQLVLAQDISINAGRNIFIKKEARNSTLEAKAVINIESGNLIGGTAQAVCGLSANEIGNDTGVNTKIIISSDLEMGTDYHNIVNSIFNHEKAIELVKMHLGPLAKNPKRVQFLKPELRGKMEKLTSKLEQLTQSLSKLVEQRDSLANSGRRSEIVRISFLKALHSGVEIQAKSEHYKTLTKLAGPATIQFDYSTNKFEAVEYRPIVCEFNKQETNNNE